jgi:hypothetical protein
MITQVGDGSQRATQTGLTGDDTLAFPANVVSGNLLVAMGCGFLSGGTAAPTITDSIGTSYTVLSVVPFTNGRLWLAYGIAPSSGACTITVDWASASVGHSYSINEYTGNHATPADVTGGVLTGNTNAPICSCDVSVPNALVIGVMAHDGTSGVAITPGPGYTQIGEEESNSFQDHAAEFKVATNTNRVLITWTLASAQPWGAFAVSFKEAEGTTGDGDAGEGYLLEDGSGNYLLEDGSGIYLLESAAAGTQFTQSVSGTLSFSGALVKETRTAKTGAISPAGTLLKHIPKVFTGSLSPVGALTKQAQKSFTASISFSGTLAAIRTILLSLTGSLSFSGTLSKQTGKTTAGSVSPTGGLTKQTQTSRSGAISPTGTLTKRTSKTFAGSLSFSGALAAVKTFVKNLVGSLSFSGTLTKQTNKVTSGSISPVGGLTKRVGRVLSGSLTLTGSLTRHITKTFSGSLSFVGSLAAVIGGKIILAWSEITSQILSFFTRTEVRQQSTASMRTDTATSSKVSADSLSTGTTKVEKPASKWDDVRGEP